MGAKIRYQKNKQNSMKTFFLVIIFSSLLFACTPEAFAPESKVRVAETHTADYRLANWISLGSPPYGAEQVISAKNTTIWVETSDNQIFTASIDFGCRINSICWNWDTASTKPENNREPWALVRGENCVSLNPNPYQPISEPDGIMQECIYAPSPGINMVGEFFFALMEDGTIWFLDNTPPRVPK